jgi:hypothetical protein
MDLSVASHRFRDVPVTLTISAPPQPNDDGLLPMALFDAIYVNNQHNFVVLNPHTKPTMKQAIAAGVQKTFRADR